MAKMTQTQIISEMSTKTGIAKKQVKDFLAAYVDLAYREAKKGEFAFHGLGKLVKQKRKARIGRNPATGERDCVSRTGNGHGILEVCVHAGEIGKYSRAPDQDFRDGNDQDNRENRIASAVSAISPSDSGPQDRDMCLEDHN